MFCGFKKWWKTVFSRHKANDDFLGPIRCADSKTIFTLTSGAVPVGFKGLVN